MDFIKKVSSLWFRKNGQCSDRKQLVASHIVERFFICPIFRTMTFVPHDCPLL